MAFFACDPVISDDEVLLALMALGEDPTPNRLAEIKGYLKAPDPIEAERDHAVKSAVRVAIARDALHMEALDMNRRVIASTFLQWSDSIIHPNVSHGTGLLAAGREVMARMQASTDLALQGDPLAVAAVDLVQWHRRIKPEFPQGETMVARGMELRERLREEIVGALSSEIYEIREHIEALRESYAECNAQYRSECALYGDAGPGQGLALRETAGRLNDLSEKVGSLLSTPEGKIIAEREEQARARYAKECAEGLWDIQF